MATYSSFVTAVKGRYYPGTPNEAAAARCVANYVKAELLRQVDGDLEAAKSYRNSYAETKLAIAGYTVTSNAATMRTAINPLITVDATRAAVSTLIDKLIQEALDELSGLATLFNKTLLDAAIDIQRLIPLYCLRQETVYHSDTAGVTVEGSVSQLVPPGARIRSVRIGLLYDALAEGVAYAVNDIVASNGRLYQCSGAGTLGVGELGSGLLTTTGDDEAIGSLSFYYYGPVTLYPVTKVPWSERDSLREGRACSVGYTIDPQATEMWVYPVIDTDRQLIVEWDGLKQSFLDNDTVAFDPSAEKAAAAYLRHKIGGASPAEYQLALRQADMSARDKVIG